MSDATDAALVAGVLAGQRRPLAKAITELDHLSSEAEKTIAVMDSANRARDAFKSEMEGGK